ARKTSVDREVVMPERETGGDADVFHRERDCDGCNEESDRRSGSVEEDRMHQGACDEDRRKRVRERSRVPGKSDAGAKNACDCEPEGDLACRASRAPV